MINKIIKIIKIILKLINKINSKLIQTVLLLEIQLRGPRIKYSARRGKMLRSKYIKNHYVYPIFKVPLIVNAVADSHRKVAYLLILKVAFTSIGRTFFDNESHRKGYDQWVKEKHIPNPDVRPRALVIGIYNNEEMKKNIFFL